jgi:hypothetical protein
MRTQSIVGLGFIGAALYATLSNKNDIPLKSNPDRYTKEIELNEKRRLELVSKWKKAKGKEKASLMRQITELAKQTRRLFSDQNKTYKKIEGFEK